MSNIALTGFMGSGKSTVGLLLARKIGRRFFDLDDIISRQAKKSVSRIFADLGEEGFRALESKALAYMAGMEEIVLACGGGTILAVSNQGLLRERFKVIFLDTPLEILTSRLAHVSDRPLLQDQGGAKQLPELYRQRYQLYLKTADITVPTAGLSATQVADQVLRQLKVETTIDQGTNSKT